MFNSVDDFFGKKNNLEEIFDYLLFTLGNRVLLNLDGDNEEWKSASFKAVSEKCEDILLLSSSSR